MDATFVEHNTTFKTHDGETLFYRRWQPNCPTDRAVVLLHRGHEHSGRVSHLVHELGLEGFSFYAWDARGHGQSTGARGDSPSFAASVRDLDCFITHLCITYNLSPQNIAVVAQSVGAVIAAAWVHDYAPAIRCMALASPAFDINLYVPFARGGLQVLHALKGNFFVNSYVRPAMLTHDKARAASYANDPLIARAISVRQLLGLYRAADRVVSDANAIQVPTQLLISGSDFVVRRPAQIKFFERLGTLEKEMHILPGFYHDTLGEQDRQQALEKIRGFIRLQFARHSARPSLLEADQMGATKSEAEALSMPLPAQSAQGLFWRGIRAGLAIGAKLSDGLKLGVRTGFDSGSTLDYVYQNRPSGISMLGRYIDQQYLNAIGWRGIRQRKQHIQELLGLAMQRLNDRGIAIHILDIAAGHGRYILEGLTSSDIRPASVLLRDYSDLNVQKGTLLIEQNGLHDIATFAKGDAFDPQSLRAIKEHPSLVIVSGLYELFGDNTMVGTSLSALASLMAPGSYLIYTGQPWHPQLEFIARALTSHRDGRPWVMRRRTQAELDQLVMQAGFSKIEQRIDEWGIFTVSIAQRSDANHVES